MKKNFYITSFTFLGFIFQQLVHGLLEKWYIGLLISDFDQFGFGFSWQTWFMVHHVFTVILLVVGLCLGFWQGKYWWVRLYDENGNRRIKSKN